MIDIDGYRRQGYWVVRGVLPNDVLAGVTAVLERQVDEFAAQAVAAGEIPERYEHLPFECRLLAVTARCRPAPRAFDPLLFSPAVRDLLCHPSLTDPLAEILGPEITYQGNGHLRAHLPGVLAPLPWHQDAQFYGTGTELMTEQMAQVWLPLVDAGVERGCPAVVPGSHRWGLLPEAVGAGNVPRSTDERQQRIYRATGARVAGEPVVLLPMRRGDFVVFSNLLVHTGTENRSAAVRWSMDVRFEATLGSRPLTPAQRQGYHVMHRRLAGRGYVPLRVRDQAGNGEDWSSWCWRREHTERTQPVKVDA